LVLCCLKHFRGFGESDFTLVLLLILVVLQVSILIELEVPDLLIEPPVLL
jgi:competence protein ComGC